jgi:hypothetical protein
MLSFLRRNKVIQGAATPCIQWFKSHPLRQSVPSFVSCRAVSLKTSSLRPFTRVLRGRSLSVFLGFRGDKAIIAAFLRGSTMRWRFRGSVRAPRRAAIAHSVPLREGVCGSITRITGDERSGASPGRFSQQGRPGNRESGTKRSRREVADILTSPGMKSCSGRRLGSQATRKAELIRHTTDCHDPERFAGKEAHANIDYYVPNFDGTLVAAGVSLGGSDERRLSLSVAFARSPLSLLA